MRLSQHVAWCAQITLVWTVACSSGPDQALTHIRRLRVRLNNASSPATPRLGRSGGLYEHAHLDRRAMHAHAAPSAVARLMTSPSPISSSRRKPGRRTRCGSRATCFSDPRVWLVRSVLLVIASPRSRTSFSSRCGPIFRWLSTAHPADLRRDPVHGQDHDTTSLSIPYLGSAGYWVSCRAEVTPQRDSRFAFGLPCNSGQRRWATQM